MSGHDRHPARLSAWTSAIAVVIAVQIAGVVVNAPFGVALAILAGVLTATTVWLVDRPFARFRAIGSVCSLIPISMAVIAPVVALLEPGFQIPPPLPEPTTVGLIRLDIPIPIGSIVAAIAYPTVAASVLAPWAGLAPDRYRRIGRIGATNGAVVGVAIVVDGFSSAILDPAGELLEIGSAVVLSPIDPGLVAFGAALTWASTSAWLCVRLVSIPRRIDPDERFRGPVQRMRRMTARLAGASLGSSVVLLVITHSRFWDQIESVAPIAVLVEVIGRSPVPRTILGGAGLLALAGGVLVGLGRLLMRYRSAAIALAVDGLGGIVVVLAVILAPLGRMGGAIAAANPTAGQAIAGVFGELGVEGVPQSTASLDAIAWSAVTVPAWLPLAIALALIAPVIGVVIAIALLRVFRVIPRADTGFAVGAFGLGAIGVAVLFAGEQFVAGVAFVAFAIAVWDLGRSARVIGTEVGVDPAPRWGEYVHIGGRLAIAGIAIGTATILGRTITTVSVPLTGGTAVVFVVGTVTMVGIFVLVDG